MWWKKPAAGGPDPAGAGCFQYGVIEKIIQAYAADESEQPASADLDTVEEINHLW